MAGTMEGLGKRIWDDNEFKAFAQSDNAKKYQDYKSQLEKDYDKNYSLGGNFMNWLGNGLSGGGWSKSSFLKNRGVTDEVDAYGDAGLLGNSSMGELRNAASNYNNSKLEQLNAGKDLLSGIPIIGSLLSAPAQVVSAGKDFADSGTSAWESGKRDWLSDLGAAGETAIDIATLGTAAGAGAGAKTLGSTMARGAMLGAGHGLTGGLNDMGAKNFDLGKLALRTGIGGAVGGGVAGLGYGIGNAWNKYSAGSPTTVAGDATPYQEALNTLKENATSNARYSDVATNLPTPQGVDLARVDLNNLDDDTLKQLFRSGLKNVRGTEGANDATTALKNSKDLLDSFLKNGVPSTTETPTNLSFGQKLKNFGSNVPNMGKDLANTKAGTKISSLLKTKKGKVAAGAGLGLLLSGLLGGKKDNSRQLSDAEQQQLYNYVYGGQ